MDCPTIQHLKQWHESLSCQREFANVEAKAEHVGLLNRIETAIARLKMCEENGIFGGAWVCVLPSVVYQNGIPEYRVVCDGESDKPEHWREVRFEKRGFVRLSGGDVVIKK